MRVAFDARSLSASALRGWDRYTVGLAGELVRSGIQVTLFHQLKEPLNPEHTRGLGCEVIGLPDLGAVAWEQFSLPRALRAGRFDVYHAPAERGVPLAAPCPTVLTIHSVTWGSYKDLIDRGLLPGTPEDYLGAKTASFRDLWSPKYWSIQVARAGHILTPSEYCRQEVIRFLGLPPEKVTATPLAAAGMFSRARKPDPALAESLARLGARRPYLLFVGGYERHKNVGGLLDVFADLRKVRPDLSLVLAGTSSVPQELLAQAEHLGLVAGRDVKFLVDLNDELVDLYDGAELLVTLSWRETFCLPLLEAMSRGVPVVASAWGAAPEVARDAGLLVDPTDRAAARDAILRLLAPRDRPSPEALRRAAGRFSWSKTAEDTLAVYRRLLAV